MHDLSILPEGSIHVDIFTDDIAAAQQHPLDFCGNWAASIVGQWSRLCMPSLFAYSVNVAQNLLSCHTNMKGQLPGFLDGLHLFSRMSPSEGPKLCTSVKLQLPLRLPENVGAKLACGGKSEDA